MTDLAALLPEAARAAGVPGAVLGVWADGRETVHATGVLSTRTGVEVTPDSVFQIGSITKTWTATMVAQLVDEGRLSYDATVADVLPGVRLGVDDVSDRVTVRHLLTHTSGIDGDIFVDTGRGDDCVERYVALLADAEQITEPGEVYCYCNSGFVLLGRMIEVLDGCVWDDALRARLVEPLGLDDVCLLPEDAILRRAAVGHHEHPHTDRPFDQWMLPRSLGPAGLITTTAHDLLGYARMHLDAGPPSLAEMREPQGVVPNPKAFGHIGLGWRLGDWDGVQVLAHDGATLGQTAMLRVVPERGFACCLLTNSAEGESLEERVLPEVFASYADLAVPEGPRPDPDARPGDLDRLAGRYHRRAVDFEVTVGDGGLTIEVLPAADLPWTGEAETMRMLPADAGGRRFVGRAAEGLPWWPVEFGELDGGRAYLCSGGRIALRG